jgi:hypothetical protein
MMVVDADSGKIVAMPRIGFGPYASGLDPDTQLVFSSNGAGALTVIHGDSPNRYTVLATLEPTGSRDTGHRSEDSRRPYSFPAGRCTAVLSAKRPEPLSDQSGIQTPVGVRTGLLVGNNLYVGVPAARSEARTVVDLRNPRLRFAVTRLAEENAMTWRLLKSALARNSDIAVRRRVGR